MKRILTFTLTVSAVIAIVAMGELRSGAQANTNVAGTWDLTSNTPVGKRTMLLIIKEEGDKLIGSMRAEQGEHQLDKIVVNKQEITFTMTAKSRRPDAPPPPPIVISYIGKVENGEMKGEVDFGGLGKGEWVAVRHKEGAAPAVSAGAPVATNVSSGAAGQEDKASGIWNLVVETPGGTGRPTFSFKQEGENLTGTYEGPLGKADVTGTVKGNDIVFSIFVHTRGQDVRITYTGKLQGPDKMKGTVRFGDNAEGGEGTWTGKKQ